MVEWKASDAETLSAYLRGNQNKLIEILRDKTPTIVGKTFEETALSAKLAQGWIDCIKTIEANAVPQRARAESSEHVDVTTGL